MKPLSEMTIEELWQLFPIILTPYNPAWPQWFAKEAASLRQLLPTQIRRLRHIGSTSVPGLTAKPTIDILLEIADNTDLAALQDTLHTHGWMTMACQPPPDYRLDLCKGYTPNGFAERVFHLHIRFLGDWDEPLFCEYLRQHPETAQEYVDLKTALAVPYKHNRDAYTDAKGDFIRRVVQLARQALS